MARGMTFDFTEFTGHSQMSPKFSADLTSQKSERVFDFAWENIDNASKEFLGYSTRTTGPTLHRVLPHQDPIFPRRVAKSCTIMGIGKPGFGTGGFPGSVVYPQARLIGSFEAPLYKLVEDEDLQAADTANLHGLGPRWHPEFDRYTIYEERPEGSYITPPATGAIFAWADKKTNGDPNAQPGLAAGTPSQSNVSIPSQVSKIVGEAFINIKWLQIPEEAIPYQSIYSCLGTVNQTQFGSSFSSSPLRFRAWSMLFLGATLFRYVGPDETFYWDIEYHFKYSGSGKQWNYLLNPRADPKGFYQVSVLDVPSGGTAIFYDPGVDTVPLNQLIYDVSNLNYLFQVE